MKFLVTFLLLISIGEIYSKTLLEKIRDDSDLSQVRLFRELFYGFGSPLQELKAKSPQIVVEKWKIFGFGSDRYITGRRKECCVIRVNEN